MIFQKICFVELLEEMGLKNGVEKKSWLNRHILKAELENLFIDQI